MASLKLYTREICDTIHQSVRLDLYYYLVMKKMLVKYFISICTNICIKVWYYASWLCATKNKDRPYTAVTYSLEIMCVH